MVRKLWFRDQSADVTLFLHAMSGRLSLTAAFFCADFFRFVALNAFLASFSRCKTMFSPNNIPPKHSGQDKIDAKLLEKRASFLTCESKSKSEI